MKFLDRRGYASLLRDLAGEYELYAPSRRDDRTVLQRFDADHGPPETCWNDARLAETCKGLWFQPARRLAAWAPDGTARDVPARRPRALVGAKACDVRALAMLDRVFRDHTYREPAWCDGRERNLVISGDCTGHRDSCFCTVVGGGPWPEEGFDLNLAPVDGGYLVETGSDKGGNVLQAWPERFAEATPAQIGERDRRRETVRAAVEEQNRRYPVREPFEESVTKNLRTRLWGELAATCVECNACNLVCPTCHCFLLRDVRGSNGCGARLSVWDSCFSAGYARMAGGGTPRLQLVERFKNHYVHKFVTFPRVWGVTACTGCGRCIDACMGRIDKRRCLHELETRWIPSEDLPEVG